MSGEEAEPAPLWPGHERLTVDGAESVESKADAKAPSKSLGQGL